MTSPIPLPNPADIINGARKIALHPQQTIRDVVSGVVPGADEAQVALDAIVAMRRWLSDRHNWTRVVWFGSGVILVLAGAGMLAYGKGSDLVPVGKITKAVKGAAK